MSRLLTIPEVSERLSLCPAACWRLVLDGTLPSYKLGRSRRVAEADVAALLAEARQEGGKAKGRGVTIRKATTAKAA